MSALPRSPPHYVAKAGVIALTEALALELAGDNILVNAIAPGPIVAPPHTTPAMFRSRGKGDTARTLGGEAAIANAVLSLPTATSSPAKRSGRRRPTPEIGLRGGDGQEGLKETRRAGGLDGGRTGKGGQDGRTGREDQDGRHPIRITMLTFSRPSRLSQPPSRPAASSVRPNSAFIDLMAG